MTGGRERTGTYSDVAESGVQHPWESRILRTPCPAFTVRIIRLGRSTYEIPSRSFLLRLSNTSSSVGRSVGFLAIMRITSWSST